MTAIQVGVRRAFGPAFGPAFGRFVLFALCAAGVALPAAAVTHHVDVLLDLDNDPATGCMVSTSEGPFAGAEEILRSVVETTALPAPAAAVTEVLRLSCVSGAIFAPPVVVDDGDWPVGVGFGVGGSNVIETYVPSDQLPADLDTIRLAVVLSSENGDDTALLFTSPGSGQPILLVLAQAIVEIPTLSEWGLILLAVLLAALAAHRLRRRAVVAALVALVVFGVAGVAWAAVLLDGDPSDWTGASELASDPPVGPCFGLHIASLHAKPGAGQLCFRVDACLLFNTPPVAADDAFTTDEDVPVAGNVLADNGSGADADPDGDPLTVETTPITPPANGGIVLAANGDFTYTPNANFNGTDSFVYRVGDGNGGTDTATVTITVGAVNDAPVANAQAVSTDEDTPVVVTLTGSDADGDALTFAIATGPTNGSLSAITPVDATSAQVTYTPNGDFTGADGFTFTASDGTATSPAATVSITVDAVNDPPVADAQAVSTDEDVPVVITLTGSDTDGDPLTFAIATGPTNGSLSAITPVDATSAQVTYTPNGDFNGADGFTFTANDGTATSPAATVSITVDAVNDTPAANAQAVSTDEDVPLVITLTGSDPDGNPLTFAIATNPVNGLLSAITPVDATSAQVTYTPGADFTGSDSFTFTVNDGTATSPAAAVSITVNPVNDPAVVDLDADDSEGTAGVDFVFAYTEGSGPQPLLDPTDATITDIDSTTLTDVTLTLTNLLDAGEELLAADASGFPNITVQAFDTTTTTGQGVLVISAAAPQPIADFVAVLRTATYEHTGDVPDPTARVIEATANDGGGAGPAATSTAAITAVNDAPVADQQAVSTDEDTPLVITLTGSDAEGDALTFAIATGPTNGSLSTITPLDDTSAQVTYTPNGDFDGADSFTFTVDDGTATSAPATVSITVDAVNDAPAANAQAVSTDEDTPLLIVLTGSDVDGDALTFAIATGPTNGSLSAITPVDATSAQVTYTPNGDFNGADSLTFTVNDGTANSPAATVSITVDAVNDTPVANAQAVSTDEDVPLVITLTGSDTDGDPLTFAIATGPTNGSLSAITPVDGTSAQVTYTPNGDFNGADSFTFTASDGTATSPAATVSITVDAVNDTPVANAQAVSTDEDTPLVVTLTGSDVDGNPLTFAIATGPTNGSLSAITPVDATSAQVTYTPNANFNGADSFTFTANDGTATSPAAAVSITVDPVNDPPVVNGASFNIAEHSANGTSVGTVTFTDPDSGQTHTFSIIAGNTNNAFAINPATGEITVADAGAVDFETTPSFSLTVQVADDGTPSLSDTATVTVTVIDVNEPPVANTDAYTGLGNTQLRADGATGTGLVATTSGVNPIDNDGDPDTNPAFNNITVLAGSGASANGGQFDVAAGGAFHYTPPVGFEGTDSFQYSLSDGTNTTLGTIQVTVSEMVWYVQNVTGADNPAAGDDGRSTNAFEVLGDVEAVVTDNDFVFVFESPNPYDGGIDLDNTGVKLHGHGVGLTVPVHGTVVPAGAQPQVRNTGAAGVPEDNGVNVIAIAATLSGIEIRGLDVSGRDNGIDVTATGAHGAGVTISNNTVGSDAATGLEGIDVNAAGTGTVTASVSSNSLAGRGNAFDGRSSVAGGALRVALSDNADIQSALGSGVVIDGSAGGATTVTGLANNSVSHLTGGSGIVVNGATFDANPGGTYQTVNGGNTRVGLTGDPVGASGVLLTNVAGDLAFTDLDLFAGGGAGGAGLRVTGTGAVNPGAGTGTRVTVPANMATVHATTVRGVDVQNATLALELLQLQVTSATAGAVSLVDVADGGGTNAVFVAPSGSTITTTGGATGVVFNVDGGNGKITYTGTLSNTGTGRAVAIDGWSGDDAGDDVLFSGAITENGAGILVNANGGSRSISFTGGLTISTTAGEGFAATSNTNAGGLHVTGTNTIASTRATALRVTNTTIGSSNLTFRTVSSGNNDGQPDPANGIVLDTTGSTGRLIVTGNGASGQGGNASGGVIQNTTGHGIALNSTTNPSFANMTIQTTGGSGVNGTGVAGFTFDNGTVTGSGNAVGESNIAFNGNGTLLGNNLTGVVTITDSILNTAFDSGIHIQSNAGTISDATLANNSLTSTTSTATSKGCGIKLSATGTASTVGSILQATISGNAIANFPSQCGIQVIGGNVSSTGPAGFVGDPTPGTQAISITGNSISGQSAANRMGTSSIELSINGGNPAQRSQGNFVVSNNNPLQHVAGTAILVGNNGYVDGTYVMNGNLINANSINASPGIGGGNGIVTSSAETPFMNWTITNNTISNTDGNGILAVGRGVTGTLNVGIRSNTVGAPLSGLRPGIRVDAGNPASADDAVCAEISNNVSGGSGGSAGIGIRKQGSNAAINDFGIEGLSPSPATCGQAEDHVSAQNPGAVATGTDCDGNGGSKTLAISGQNFVSCNAAP